MTGAPLDAFVASLTGAAPPPDARGDAALRGVWHALRGVWHALRGEWELAHEVVQPDDAACAWVHAALHREEGDLDNARYWYGAAGRRAASGPARAEYFAIAAALLGDADREANVAPSRP